MEGSTCLDTGVRDYLTACKRGHVRTDASVLREDIKKYIPAIVTEKSAFKANNEGLTKGFGLGPESVNEHHCEKRWTLDYRVYQDLH
ncbi:unnamed protein product [Danaus chrysippus]|uniref:(African queen) hypothetical protein n=1 Tax=Danaus chrysippus TaxID=151541 RepID=A0A8J2QKT7_9NEOP|nr:unnamed protein product [Danaus chrysippus]